MRLEVRDLKKSFGPAQALAGVSLSASVGAVHAVHGVGRGKGNALWASLAASTGDIVVWCDGDVTTVEPNWVARLVFPLLADDGVVLVKADYHRPTEFGGGVDESVASASRWYRATVFASGVNAVVDGVKAVV